ncbi:MAG: hypothetical protein RJR37_07470 [Peptococcaceae bacterium MAG4]|nr:hypothetical protein [Peptococcaceae bacterium MAG4]
MEIIRSLNPILLSIIELVIKNLSGKMNFSEFQDQLADKLNETGRRNNQTSVGRDGPAN